MVQITTRQAGASCLASKESMGKHEKRSRKSIGLPFGLGVVWRSVLLGGTRPGAGPDRPLVGRREGQDTMDTEDQCGWWIGPIGDQRRAWPTYGLHDCPDGGGCSGGTGSPNRIWWPTVEAVGETIGTVIFTIPLDYCDLYITIHALQAHHRFVV